MSADERDDEPPIIAVIDEAAPADRQGIYYVVTAAIMLDVAAVRQGLAEVVPTGRIRPFHWATEGPQARNRMMELLIETGVVAHVVVHYPTGRRRQDDARRSAMVELVPLVVAEGAAELIIESRSEREDQRDRQSVIEAMRLADHNIGVPVGAEVREPSMGRRRRVRRGQGVRASRGRLVARSPGVGSGRQRAALPDTPLSRKAREPRLPT